MKLLSTARIVPPLVVAVVLAAVYALAAFAQPFAIGAGGQPVPPVSLAVNSATRACPAPGAGAAGSVALVAIPGRSGPGRAEVSALGGAPLASVSQTGTLSVTTVPAARPARGAASGGPSSGGLPAPAVPTPGGVMVQASGAVSRGLEVEQTVGGSAASFRCGSPGTDFWFVGPGQSLAGRVSLYLINPGSQAADVNVQLTTDAGPRQGNPDTGINVPPGAMVVQPLSGLVHGSNVAALHVTTTVGQVVAAVEMTSGSVRSGAWLPAAQQPVTHLVIPGLPGTSGARDLYVLVPGSQDAHLKITAVTSRGSYEPTGGGSLDIPGGTAVSIPLNSMAGIPAALALTSSVPVTATVMLPGGSSGAPGVFTTAVPALQQQGVVAVDRSGGGTTSQLVLSAPGRAARARVSLGGSGAGQVVSVPSGHSVVVPLGKAQGAPRGTAYPVVVTPLAGSGPLYAGRALEGGGSLISILPIVSALQVVPLPAVRQAFITTGG